MVTTTDRLARTRIRVSPGSGGGRCRVRTAITTSDPTVAVIRPILTRHDARRAQVSLVPEGALLLAGDAIEIDITVDPGAALDLVEPGGTVAFDMRGATARWDVCLDVGSGATLTWAAQPFVVAQGADVTRATRIRYAPGARIAVREMLVLGRFGEPPGAVRQTACVRSGHRPLLVEDLSLDATTTPALIGGSRVMSTVLAIGAPVLGPGQDRFDLAADDAVLWRRLGLHAHEAGLDEAWRVARGAMVP